MLCVLQGTIHKRRRIFFLFFITSPCCHFLLLSIGKCQSNFDRSPVPNCRRLLWTTPMMHILTSFFTRSLSFNWIWSKEKKCVFPLALVLATQTPIKKRVSFFSFFYVHTSSYSLELMTSYSLMCILLAALSIIALVFFSWWFFFLFFFYC